MKQNLEELIFKWNSLFPLDRIWRKKYNIPFGSPQHLSMDPLMIALDIKEDELFNTYVEEQLLFQETIAKARKNGDQNKFVLTSIKEGETFTQEEVDKMFDELDINDYNKDLNGEDKV